MEKKGMGENKETPNLKMLRRASASTFLAARGTVSTAMPASLSTKGPKGEVEAVREKLP